MAVGEFEVGHHVCECLHVLKFDPEFSQVCLERMVALSEKLRNSIRPKNYTQWRVKLVATGIARVSASRERSCHTLCALDIGDELWLLQEFLGGFV